MQMQLNTSKTHNFQLLTRSLLPCESYEKLPVEQIMVFYWLHFKFTSNKHFGFFFFFWMVFRFLWVYLIADWRFHNAVVIVLSGEHFKHFNEWNGCRKKQHANLRLSTESIAIKRATYPGEDLWFERCARRHFGWLCWTKHVAWVFSGRCQHKCFPQPNLAATKKSNRNKFLFLLGISHSIE